MAPLLGVAVFLAVLGSTFAPAARAATSSSYLNFQARLMANNGSIVPDGNYNIDFKIYNADSTTGSVGTCSGACLWEETRKNSNAQGVQVINGYFSVNLGSVTSFPAINWDQQLWLTMNIGGTTTGASPTWDGEMQNSGHSVSLTAIPYSFIAGQLALTSGAHRGTLAFNTVANDPNILLPDASGTVCLQSAVACGFELTSGTDFIRNQTSTQTANFNVQSASSSSIAGVITGAGSQSVDIFDVNANGVGTPLLAVGSNGSLTVTPSAAAGTITLGSTTQTGTITLGRSTATNNISIGAAAGNGNIQTIDIGTSVTAGSTTNVNIGSSIAGTTTVNGNLTLNTGKNFTVNGDVLTDLTGTGLTVSSTALSIDQASSLTWTGIEAFNGATTFTPSSTNNVTFTGDNDSNVQVSSTISADVSQNALSISLTDNANASTGTLYGFSLTNNDNGANTGVPDAVGYIKNANAAETVPSGLLVEQTGSGTLTNGIEIKRTAGTVNNGITLTGTFATNYINAPNFFVTGGGALGSIGVDSHAGLIQGTGGLSVSGAITLGSTTQTNAIIVGQSTDDNTISIGSNNSLASGKTQTINIGTSTGSGSTTNVSIGSSIAGTTTVNGALTLASGKTLTVNGDAFTDLTGNGLVLSSNTLAIDATTTSTTATTSSNSGLEVSSDGLRLLGGCTASTADILKWNGTNWVCSADAGAGTDNVSVNSVAATDANFIDTTNTASVAGVSWTLNAGPNPDTIQINISAASASLAGIVTNGTQSFGGAKTFNGDVSTVSTSTSAFQVQDGSNADYLNVNTTDGYVINNGAADLATLVQNPSFESSGTTDATGWYTPSGSQVITNSSANAHSGNYELQVTGNSSTHAVTTKYFAVHPGDTVYAEAWVKNSGGANGDGGIYLEFSDKDKGNASFSNADTGLPGTSYILKSITTTVPAGKVFVRIAASVKATSSTGTFYFDDFYLKRANEQAPLLITNVSSTAFQVQNSSSITVLGVDSTNSKIFTTIADSGTAVGFTLNTPSYTTSGAKLLSLQNNNAEKFYVDKDGKIVNQGGVTAAGNITTSSGNISTGAGGQFQINGTQISSADLSNNSNLAKLNGTGPQTFSGDNKFTGTALVQNANAAGFQVQNATNAVFTVDTSGNKVILGTASNITGKIQFQGSGGAGTLTLTGPTTPDAGNYTLSIPAITANANICTDNSICTGYASSSSLTSGLAGKLNKNTVDTSAAAVTAVQANLYAFTNNSSNIASGILKLDNGNNTGNVLTVTGTNNYGAGGAYIVVNNTNGTPGGYLLDLQSNAASEFNVDASGNVAAAGNISIASGKQYQINGVQITSGALSDGSTLAKLGSNQTFTGINTFSNASNSFTGDGSGLTNLNATNVASGTLGDGRLSSNVALLNRSGQSFTGDNTFAPTSNGAGTTIKQTSGTATSGSVLDVQTANGTSHFLQITNAAANEGNVTLQSVGATRDLTLGSRSGTIIIAAAANTIQHNNSGLTIDINNGTDSTFTIT
ncbi:MAG TPA: hypothetical protein VLF88_01210, partial [Candidatus Babeliales bacterium]|nr:hypothetical protein [Candidatus Babeliales bacterium]